MNPTKIYLDQNKWLDLARAYHNRRGGEKYTQVLEMIERKVNDGEAIFPLSDFHIVETQNRKDRSSRQRLAKAMANISLGWAIAPLEKITPIEIQRSGARLFGTDLPGPPIVFNRGVTFALGIDAHALFEKQELNASDNVMQQNKALFLSPLGTEVILVGTRENALRSARKHYDESLGRFVVDTEKFRAQFYPHNQSEDFHKGAYIRNLGFVLRPIIDEAFAGFGKKFDDLLELEAEKQIEFFEGVPTLDVEIGLRARSIVNRDRIIKKNDMADLAFLARAIPYCDIVVTENYWKHLVEQSKLDKKYSTLVLSDVNELISYLG